MNSKLICVEGNIGVGKTTFVERFAEKTGATPIYESFIDNPFLPAFYKNPKTNAFQLEMSFLIERFNQLKDLFSNPKNENNLFIADYNVSKTLIFAQLNLKEHEFEIFKQYYNVLIKDLPTPALTIYLYTSLKQIAKNIKNRNRNFERTIKADYLKNIQLGYDKIFQNKKSSTIVPVEFNEKMWQNSDQIIDTVHARFG